MSSKVSAGSSEGQYALLIETFNSKKRVVYNKQDKCFSSMSAEDAKKLNKSQFKTDLWSVREKVIEFISINDLKIPQKTQLLKAISGRLKQNEGSFSLKKAIASLYLKVLYKEIEAIPVPLDLNVINEELEVENNHGKKLTSLMQLCNDQDFIKILENEKVGDYALSKDELHLLFGSLKDAHNASSWYQTSLKNIITLIKQGKCVEARKKYSELIEKGFRYYVAMHTRTLKSLRFSLEAKVSNKLATAEKTYRRTHPEYQQNSIMDWMATIMQTPIRHEMLAKQNNIHASEAKKMAEELKKFNEA